MSLVHKIGPNAAAINRILNEGIAKLTKGKTFSGPF